MKWLVLSKPTCSRCVEAVKLLESKDLNVEIVDINEDYEHWFEFITDKLGRGEVPQIKSPSGEWFDLNDLVNQLGG